MAVPDGTYVRSTPTPSQADVPFFSVIIPTCDRPDALRRCLAALAAQHYPADRFEIIVVDDGGTVPLEPLIADVAREVPETALLRQANTGPAGARNAAAQRARGEVLAFTDDDCAPTREWLSVLARRHGEEPGRMIGGRTVNALQDNACSTTSQLIVELVYDHFNADPERAMFLSSNNMSVPRERFLQLGGFDADLRISEDRELCDRWRHAGYRIVYEPDAVIGHAHPMTLAGFVRRHFGRGRGAYAYHRIRNMRRSSRLRDEFSFHRNLRNLVVYPFTRVPPRKALPLGLLLLIWQVTNTAGFAWEAIRAFFNSRRWEAS